MDNSVKIHKTAEVSNQSEIGAGTVIWNNAQVREGAKIGKKCIVSKDVYIDTKVSIGNGVKIQNGVSVYKGVTVEDDVFLGPHMTFTNDFYPRAFNSDWETRDTVVKKGASIGANATIICGTNIGEFSMVGSGSVVSRDVPPYGLVVGNPARLKGFVCKCGQKIASLKQNFESDKSGLESDYLEVICKKCGEVTKISKKYSIELLVK